MKSKSLRICALMALVLSVFAWGPVRKATAAAISDVIVWHSSGTSSYPLLWKDVNGLLVSRDITANAFRLKPYAVTSNTTLTLTVNDGNEIRIGAISGNLTMTIPSAVVAGDGYILDLQDVGGVLDATHALAINATAGNINGASSKAYSTAYGGLRFISNGANWFCR